VDGAWRESESGLVLRSGRWQDDAPRLASDGGHARGRAKTTRIATLSPAGRGIAAAIGRGPELGGMGFSRDPEAAACRHVSARCRRAVTKAEALMLAARVAALGDKRVHDES